MRVVMLTSGAVLVLTTAAFFSFQVMTFRELTKNQLKSLSIIIAGNSASILALNKKEDAQKILGTLRAEQNVESAALYDANGKLFSSYSAKPSHSSLPARPAPDGYRFFNNHLEIYQSVVAGNTKLGTLYIRSDLKAIWSHLGLYGIIASVFIFISFLFAYFLSRRLQTTISGPILNLASLAEEVSEKANYAVRATKKSNDEVGTLTDAFNHMLSEIEKQTSEITSLNLGLENKIRYRTLELQEANKILKQQNEFVETIIDSSVDFIAVFDKNLRYLVLNDSACRFYSVQKEDIIGKYLLDVFPQVKNSAMMEDLGRALQGEVVHNPDYTSAVTNRHIENFFIPLKDENNEIDRVLVIGHDITSMMETNAKLLSLNTELEKSNRDLEQFAYIASHDLQEPLRKIQTFSELSSRNTHNPEILKRYLEKINSSAKRMTQLIKAVLNYSRIAIADKEFTAVDLNAIVEHIKTDLELIIDERKAIIHSTRLPVIEANELQMHQLFLNVISNSLKFCEQSPVIKITYEIMVNSEAKTKLGIESEQDYIALSFEDNGIGFELEYADKIFSIFQRLQSSKNYAGTGIGLALCKKIVENHSGIITVESMPGQGSTFHIYLPITYNVGISEELVKTEESIISSGLN
jgi:PAS domain S-box-containing protein